MRLFESIQIKEGIPQRLNRHNKRMNRSRNELFCLLEDVYLEDYIQIPKEFSKGIVKCRVEYAEQIGQIEFKNYKPQMHDKFYLVDAGFDYHHKFVDRANFAQLKSNFPTSSEIIIIKNGFITDTSYSNLIFKDKNGKWFTPDTYLLKGTQREYLLDKNIISEKSIHKNDLNLFTHFMMINAMLDFNESREISIDKISY